MYLIVSFPPVALGALIPTEAKVFDIWIYVMSTEYIERQGRDGWQLLAWLGASLRPQPPFRLASLHPGWLAVDLSHSTQLRVRSLRSTTATYAPQTPIAASRCITPSSG